MYCKNLRKQKANSITISWTVKMLKNVYNVFYLCSLFWTVVHWILKYSITLHRKNSREHDSVIRMQINLHILKTQLFIATCHSPQPSRQRGTLHGGWWWGRVMGRGMGQQQHCGNLPEWSPCAPIPFSFLFCQVFTMHLDSTVTVSLMVSTKTGYLLYEVSCGI